MEKLKICHVADGQIVDTQRWVRYFSDRAYDVQLVAFAKTGLGGGVKAHNIRCFSKLVDPLRMLDMKKAVEMMADV